MKNIYLLFALLVIFVSACSPSGGKVVSKRFEPAYYLTTTVCTPKMVCAPSTQYFEDSWYISVKSETGTTEILSSKDEYEKCSVGDTYTPGGGCN